MKGIRAELAKMIFVDHCSMPEVHRRKWGRQKETADPRRGDGKRKNPRTTEANKETFKVEDRKKTLT